MKLNVEKLKQGNIIKAQNGVQVDNTRTSVKEKVKPIPLNQEQQQNFKLYGSLNRPEIKQTYLSQGKKLTPAEQQASNKKLAEQGKLQAYQKQKEKEAKDLQRAAEVAPYVIPGIGQAMWAGKAVDLATSGASDGKYKSWGNMVDQKTGSGEFIGELTNPGYYAGAFPKLVGKGIQSTSKYALQKAEPYLMGDKGIPMMKGYKPKSNFIDNVNDKFVSEINWSNWNKEIPKNTQLMKEYNAIEQTAKANGTWMKNPNGSAFRGTLEQFVQQNSDNFKKAFPQSAEITYRGIKNNTPDLLNNRAMFTADKRLAKAYTTTDDILTPFNTVDDRGLYEMYRKKSNNGIELDVRGSHWKDLSISNKIMPRSYFKKQIGYQKNNLKYNNSRLSDHNLDVAEIPYLLNNKKHLENELKHFQDGLLNRKDMVNRKGVNNLKEYFKDSKNISTDNVAKYIEDKNLDYIKLKNVSDNLIGTETIVNHKPGNYLKSAVGNNGMFDMTNPNIYKGLIPAAGLYGLTQSKKQGGILKAQEGGLLYPKVNQLINRTNQKNIDFINRLKDPNRKFITNWENPNQIATHKMSWATDDKGAIIYPNVQNIKGKLIDFTRPPYNKWAGYNSAIQNNDTIQATPEVAQEYTTNYKKFYPQFNK